MISKHIRANAVGYTAVFLALTGTAAALPGRATVQSNDIRPNAVKAKHIKDGQVGSADVAGDSLTGADIDESTLSIQGGGSPTGPAGGDLAGSYPNPQLAPNVVGGPEVADNALTGADINEGTLSGLSASPVGPAGGDLTGPYPNPQIAASAVGAAEVVDSSLSGSEIVNDTIAGPDVNERFLELPGPIADMNNTCNPASETFTLCSSQVVEFMGPDGGDALAVASIRWHTNAGGGAGDCRFMVTGGPVLTTASMGETSDTTEAAGPHESTLLGIVSGDLGQKREILLQCNETTSDITISEAHFVILGNVTQPV